MSRKGKIEPIEKTRIVERYLKGEIGIKEAGRQANVAYQSVQRWISIYDTDGPVILLNQSKNQSYSKELKINAVNDYLNGNQQVRNWVQKYEEMGLAGLLKRAKKRKISRK